VTDTADEPVPDARPPRAPREEEMNRLRWQCRRGMLELDLLLHRFLAAGYPALDDGGRTDFVRLLGYPDQILQDWLIGGAAPADPALCRLVPLIRNLTRDDDPPAPAAPEPADR
jgi:antitoxin CptB